MKTYINPTINVVNFQTESVILGVSSGGDGPVGGVNENTKISGGGARVPGRIVWI